jgi:hypothetical protein
MVDRVASGAACIVGEMFVRSWSYPLGGGGVTPQSRISPISCHPFKKDARIRDPIDACTCDPSIKLRAHGIVPARNHANCANQGIRCIVCFAQQQDLLRISARIAEEGVCDF